MKKAVLLILIVLVSVSCKNKIKKTSIQHKITLPKQSKKPSITVIDTDFSKGRLDLKHQITLDDLEKFHGHLCDGLVVGFLSIKEGLNALYPNGIIDRTNTRIVSKSAPCLTDVAVYITGGRYQFNSFYVSNKTVKDAIYIIQRKDNGKTVSVKMNKGVKPEIISEMGKKATKGELASCDLDKLKQLEINFSNTLLNSDSSKNFTVTVLEKFDWKPIIKNDYIKTDVLNKNKAKCPNQM